MQYLKIIPLFIIVIILASSPVYGQSEPQQYELVRLRVVPGQEQAFIHTQAKMMERYQSACDWPWHFYVFSNHTFEVVLPTWEGAEKDCPKRLITGYFTELETVRNMVVVAPAQPLYKHSDLSYLPAELDGKAYPDPYYEVVTYRVAAGQWGQMMEHLQELTLIHRKMNSPLTFTCYSEGGEAAENTFKLVYSAEDPDDLAERRAVHENNAPGALRYWRSKLPLLAEAVSTVTGCYVYELSQGAEQDRLGVSSSSRY